MIKTCFSDSWEFGTPAVSLLHRSSRGFTGVDRQALIKKSGEDFVIKAGGVTLHPGEIPLHVIAMGATEAYGPNRNGDGFKMAMLRACAPSFVKHARFYRHHKNKDPDRSYGAIKLAYVNEPMKRIELLIALNGTKQAAERNGGLVADEEMEKLESGEDLAGSMAARVPYDECSACGNKSKSRKDYCKSAEEGGKCTLFGCYTGLTKVGEDGHIQHVDNPSGTFFDWSKVGKPADRIAYGNKADYLDKAAAENRVMSGEELAEMWGVTMPLSLALSNVADSAVRNAIKYAYVLAAIEDEVDTRVIQPFHQEGIKHSEQIKDTEGMLTALAKVGILVSPEDYLRINGIAEDLAKKSAEHVSYYLPGVYNRLISEGGVERAFRDTALRPAEKVSAQLRNWAEAQVASNSLGSSYTYDRTVRAAFRDEHQRTWEKASSAPETGYAEVAEQYAMYKLAFAPLAGSLLTPKTVVLHNYLT